MAYLTDATLEKQAHELAEKALPATLPQAVRSAKLPAVAAKILDRLKKQRDDAQAKAAAAPPPAAAPPGVAAPGAPAPPLASAPGALAPPPPASAPPPPPQVVPVVRIEGVELFGDELWFCDPMVRRRLRESVVEAHREQKILVGPPAEEVARICPTTGRILGAGAVLRLGGAHQGGYGEPDVAYAYRQLARALHPDKNPNLPTAPDAFKRLSEAQDELKQGLTEQRAALKLLVSTMGSIEPAAEELDRPQEALFAEACRMLCAVNGLVGEGAVPSEALARVTGSFAIHQAYQNCQPQNLLNEWFQGTRLMELFGGPSLRTAYDCAPKRCRAQFLCLLDRTLVAEAKRYGDDCVRGSWNAVMQNYPELGLWRDFRERLKGHVWEAKTAADEVVAVVDETEVVDAPPAAPSVPELDAKTKALKLLEYTFQACSGPDFQSAYEALRKRGKMSLQLGIMQLVETANTEAAKRLGLEGWSFKQTLDTVKAHGDDAGIRKKALELERMLQQGPGKLFGLRERSGSNDRRRSRSRSRKRSRSRRRRRRRSHSRSHSRRRSRSGRRKRDDDRRKEDRKKADDEKEKAEKANGDKKSKWDMDPDGEKKEKEVRIPGRTAQGLPVYRLQWDSDGDGGTRKCATWARKWRKAMAALTLSGVDGAVSIVDVDLRAVTAALWKEVVQWAERGETARALMLFRADKQTSTTFGWADGSASKASRGLDPETPPCDWAFVPMADLLLTVGEGVVGITAEGVFADSVSGHQRFTLAEYKEKVGDPSRA